MDPLAILASRTTEQRERHSRPHLWPLIIVVLILLVVALLTLGKPTPTDPSLTPTPYAAAREARVYTVTYRYGVFSPTNLRIHAGDTVRWRNDSTFPVQVIAQLQGSQRTPEFDSIGEVQPGSYFSYTFSTAGVFGYHNPDDTNQAGVIIVRE